MLDILSGHNPAAETVLIPDSNRTSDLATDASVQIFSAEEVSKAAAPIQLLIVDDSAPNR